MSTLFNKQGSHDLYERLRDPGAWMNTLTEEGTPEQQQRMLTAYLTLRQRMEKAWISFETSAEKNFLDGFRRTFWPGWFELRVQSIIHEFGLENKATNREGEPDFILHKLGLHCYNIEATVLTAGHSNANSVLGLPMAEIGQPVVQDVSETTLNTAPDGKFLGDAFAQARNPYSQNDFCLRLTGTMASKLKQIERWRSVGSLDPQRVPIIVAISSAQIDYDTNRFITDRQFELVFYGKGDLRVPIVDRKMQPDSAHFVGRNLMTNKNEAEIQLGLFHLPEYRDISAVVHFPETLLAFGNPPPVFFLIHNASTTFPTEILPVGIYKTFDKDRIKVVADFIEQDLDSRNLSSNETHFFGTYLLYKFRYVFAQFHRV